MEIWSQTIPDLQDAFFCILVDEQSQLIFAFKWETLTTKQKIKLCWTVLQQGFKNSPTVLAKEQWQGYCTSEKKAQVARNRLWYLGFEITQGQMKFNAEQKEAICRIAVPTTKKQLRRFLGMAGWCRLWIPNFGLITKPLYTAIKGPFE